MNPGNVVIQGSALSNEVARNSNNELILFGIGLVVVIGSLIFLYKHKKNKGN